MFKSWITVYINIYLDFFTFRKYFLMPFRNFQQHCLKLYNILLCLYCNVFQHFLLLNS